MFNIVSHLGDANKITIRYHTYEGDDIKKMDNNKCWGECGRIRIFIRRWWECKKVQVLWKTNGKHIATI